MIKLVETFSLDDANFCESFYWAVGNLSYPDEANQDLLNSLGACSWIVKVRLNHWIGYYII